jgi:DNA helicase-2/ATP-dependent DNA helicase PcrA
MTLHTAKGLEFDVVFLVGLEEGLLPHSRSADSATEVEEERRLFYVGLTRAREKACLSFARRRMLFGSHRDAIPSRFLHEIPPVLVRWEEAGSPQGKPFRGAKVAGSPSGRVTAAPGPPRKTRRVRHPLFGEGKVEAVEGEGEERKIIARFPGYGVKKILVRAVRMELLD